VQALADVRHLVGSQYLGDVQQHGVILKQLRSSLKLSYSSSRPAPG
jgi:hypothetical protein